MLFGCWNPFYCHIQKSAGFVYVKTYFLVNYSFKVLRFPAEHLLVCNFLLLLGDLFTKQTLHRRVTRGGGGGGEVSPALFEKLEKRALICGKKCLNCGHLWVKFSFKMQFLRVSRRKNQRFFPCRDFLSCVLGECLSKCPNSKKTPLP